MNTRRILAGGLLAGVVINIGETILNVPIIGTEFDAAARQLGLPPMTGSTVALFMVMCLALGIVTTWLYAAMRPRFGPGVQTALITGLAVWLLVSAWTNLTSAAMGLFPTRLLVITTLWQAVEIPLATLAGAWVYREEATSPKSAPEIRYETVV
jgi:hypothetical protein